MTGDTESQELLKIVVYHEVGHAVVMELLGKPFKYIQIAYRKPESYWYGNTPPLEDNFLDIIPQLPILHLVPDDEYKDVRDWCIIKFAGSVAERLLGINEKRILQGSLIDRESAISLLSQKFSSEKLESELRNAELLARETLSNPIYWNKVQNIAQRLINDIVRGKKPQTSNDYRNVFEFSRDEII